MSATFCFSCGHGEADRVDPPTCACRDGLSDRGDACVLCTSPCLKCYTEASNDCITCVDEHYIDGKDCKKC